MPHIVKRGETLAKIAKANGLSLGQLLEANPKFKAHPNQLQVGDTLLIPGEKPTPVPPVGPAPLPQPPPVVGDRALGLLSEKFETGGKGPGTVSTGIGDKGGVSYGSYQMTSKPRGGRVREFIRQADFPFQAQFAGLNPGSPAFTTVWKNLAATRREEFQELQHAFIKRTHFDLLVNKIRIAHALDVTTRSHALQDVIWSASVQHGPGTSLVSVALKALEGVTLIGLEFDEKLIRAIYAERGRKDTNGILVHFSGNSLKVQKGVANRYRQEEQDALTLLKQEIARAEAAGS